MLPYMEKDNEYISLIAKIKPGIIAVTKEYPNINYHQNVAKLVKAKIKYVTRIIGNHSTSKILNHQSRSLGKN